IAKLDRTQLIRIITNLVKNAIQAISIVDDPKVDIELYDDANNVFITVADNGHGVSEENKTRVFEPKFTTKTSGMGLGLPMIKNIIETYKGSITFTSVHGEGSIFKVTLPKG
ncbi:MAG: two-component sensor histidine kinase, partial [Bacteroidetes bacterium]